MAHTLAKAPTGIFGLDELTGGGLPAGRPTLLCGGPGCGKTILAMEFLVHGARDFREPGLYVSFDESAQSLREDCLPFAFDLEGLIAQKRLKIAHVDMSHGEIVEAGAFSLDGLMIRLAHGIAEVGAKRMVLDSLESVFAALSDSEMLRHETARLFHWIRDKGITAIVTGERGTQDLTRYGFEEYISDCVLLLDHRVSEQVSKRRMRLIKYRGSAHATDEFPFVIGKTGISVLPITSLNLDCPTSAERVSTGVGELDAMLGQAGYFKGTTVLVSGKAGTGKSSLAAAFAAAACARQERCLYLAFEESAAQLTRNMRSVRIDLEAGITRGLLTIQAFRPTFRGLEEHLIAMTEAIDKLTPGCVVMDPITNFISVGSPEDVRSMLTRFIDHLKTRGITLFFTALTAGSGRSDETGTDVSYLVDTWIALDVQVVGNTRHRELYVVKSRGMDHSRETRELILSSHGLSLRSLRTEERP